MQNCNFILACHQIIKCTSAADLMKTGFSRVKMIFSRFLGENEDEEEVGKGLFAAAALKK